MTGLLDDADVLYHGMITDQFPCPLLYLYGDDDASRTHLVPTVKMAGLPALRIDGPEEAATLVVEPARGHGWQVTVGPGDAFTVHWPGPRALVYGGGMSTPGWREAAVKAGECWLLVGPPRTWNDTATIHEVFNVVWRGGGALGVLPVVAEGWTPPGLLASGLQRPSTPGSR